jgi:hypothetical protein
MDSKFQFHILAYKKAYEVTILTTEATRMIHYIFFLHNFPLVSQVLAARNYQPSLFKTFYFNKNFFIITSLFFFFYRVRVHRSQALVSFKKFMPPPLPYFKVNISCPLPLPHFASLFFAYL